MTATSCRVRSGGRCRLSGVVFLLLLAALAACADQEVSGVRVRVVEIEQIVVIDPGDPTDGANRIVLRPLDRHQSDLLSADEALAMFESVNAEFRGPPDAAASLGSLTHGSDVVGYRFAGRTVWAFNWRECPPPPPLPPGAEDTSQPPGPCVLWLFLDASSGEMLEALYQK